MKLPIRNLMATVGSILLLSTAFAAEPGFDNRVMAARSTSALKAARDIDRININEVINLILQGNFTEFENRSTRYEQKFLADPLYESPFFKMYHALDGKNARVLEKLDEWVKSRPSYMSYGARGSYKVNRGYIIRGGAYIKDTPPDQIAGMRRLHAEAKEDLLIAINENKRFSAGYYQLIEIARATGMVDADYILALAVRSIPETYYVRYAYLRSLRPRWGGSYEEMQKYADSLGKEALRNPRIWTLKGEVAADRGSVAALKEDYNKAIQYYTEALSYGDRMEFLRIRGVYYMRVKQYQLALNDFLRFKEFNIADEGIDVYIRDLEKLLKRPHDGQRIDLPK